MATTENAPYRVQALPQGDIVPRWRSFDDCERAFAAAREYIPFAERWHHVQVRDHHGEVLWDVLEEQEPAIPAPASSRSVDVEALRQKLDDLAERPSLLMGQYGQEAYDHLLGELRTWLQDLPAASPVETREEWRVFDRNGAERAKRSARGYARLAARQFDKHFPEGAPHVVRQRTVWVGPWSDVPSEREAPRG